MVVNIKTQICMLFYALMISMSPDWIAKNTINQHQLRIGKA